MNIPRTSVPDDAFLNLALGTYKYVYVVTAKASTGRILSGITIKGIVNRFGQSAVTDSNGVVVGFSGSPSVTLIFTSDKREAQYCVRAIKPYNITYPVAFDLEYDSIRYMEGNGVVPTKQLVSDMGRAFLSETEKAGYFAVNYSNPDFIAQYFDKAIQQRYGSWLASWFDKPNYNNPPKCLLWQHGTMHIPGIGDVDGNVDLFDFPNWRKGQPVEKPVDKYEQACSIIKQNGGEKVVIGLAEILK